ncbi:MAG: NAD(P)/FAD-dependent oxidoreductase [Acidimicrobiia bacterium]|nr:NAD(P)/FAD-dependent oxidoreductase [Acidimicrobiia bacterium]
MAEEVVIVGGGFAGLTAAQNLKRADVNITLIDRTNHHLFQPLLYQVATGGLSPADIASPIRHILRKQDNVRVIEDTVVDVTPDFVRTMTGEYAFDHLVIATGATHHYFGNDDWEDAAPGLKTLPDATRIRARILEAFERAERTGSSDLTFLVVGGGPTGVEMAGAIAEMARHTLRRDFRTIDPSAARVLLAEAGSRILATYPKALSHKAEQQLARLGVEVRTGWQVTDLSPGSATLRCGDLEETVNPVATVWGAGVRASSLGAALVPLGAALDRMGRVEVLPDLTIPGHPNIHVVGDLAALTQGGKPIPGVAPAAMQMGRYVADRIQNKKSEPFRYRDKGNLATIGRSAGVADLGRIRFSGFPAWAAWLGIHIFFLIGFQNRLLVMIQWAWSYVTRNRSARLIVRYDD